MPKRCGVKTLVNLTFVKSFVTLAETGSFQKAAERLNLAQPTLSQHISKLEESLGVQLIERRRVGSRATPEGETALAIARTLLMTADHMVQAVKRDFVRIGASSNIAEYYVAPALSQLTSTTGKTLQWQIEQADNPNLILRLKDGLVDIAITEWLPEEQSFESRFWRSEEMVIILPPDHRHASQSEISLAELSAIPMIGGGQGTGTGTLLREVLGTKADRLKTSVSMGSTQAVKSAVASGLGCSIVLRGCVKTDLKAKALAALTLKDYDLRKSFYVSFSKERSNHPAIQRFMTELLARSPKTPRPSAP